MFIKYSDLKWKDDGYWCIERNAQTAVDDLKIKYPCSNCYLEIRRLSFCAEHWVHIEFSDVADEAEFIMRESL